MGGGVFFFVFLWQPAFCLLQKSAPSMALTLFFSFFLFSSLSLGFAALLSPPTKIYLTSNGYCFCNYYSCCCWCLVLRTMLLEHKIDMLAAPFLRRCSSLSHIHGGGGGEGGGGGGGEPEPERLQIHSTERRQQR